MNGIFEFLIGCVIVAICVGIGFFVIQFAIMAIIWIFVLLAGGISWVIQKLTGH